MKITKSPGHILEARALVSAFSDLEAIADVSPQVHSTYQ